MVKGRSPQAWNSGKFRRPWLVGLGHHQLLGQLYGGLFYLRVSRLQVEQDLDDKAPLLAAPQMVAAPTIQFAHKIVLSSFPSYTLAKGIDQADPCPLSIWN